MSDDAMVGVVSMPSQTVDTIPAHMTRDHGESHVRAYSSPPEALLHDHEQIHAKLVGIRHVHEVPS